MPRYRVTVVDNDTEYHGLFEADSIGHVVDLVWASPEFSNCQDFWRTPVVTNGREHLCGFIDSDYYETTELPQPCAFGDVESIANGSGGVAVYVRETKTPTLNILLRSDL